MRYVREALPSYHDPVRLRASPLLELWGQATPGMAAAAQLRELIRDAIESLRPEPSLPATHPAWLRYRLLTLRYLGSRTPVEVSEQLGFSVPSYYRYNHGAVEAIAEILWERYQSRPGDRALASAEPEAPGESRARDEAVRLARETGRQPVDLAELLAGVERTIQPVATQQGLALHIDAPRALPITWGDPAILRQIILNVLTEGLKLAVGDALRLEISLSPAWPAGHAQLFMTAAEVMNSSDATRWCLGPLTEAAACWESLPGLAVSQGLLEVYEGSMGVEPAEGGTLTLSFNLPIGRPKLVLIVDDDADTMRLYQRCLQAESYAVATARTGEELRSQLAEAVPDIILLDVLMPREDGWQVLEQLRATPETAHVPVIICSVLSEPAVGLALGAASVLRKPIPPETLIATVRAALAEADSQG